MRSYDPADEYDIKELARLNAEQWMVDCLAYNPDYVHWGIHEDSMIGKDKGWSSAVSVATWKEFTWKLDELNECVNFHFAVNRDSETCTACGGDGYNPATSEIARSFYDHEHRGGRWVDSITDDEAKALWDAGRLRHEFKEQPTGAQVNAWNRVRGLGHDGINRMILIEARAKRLGVYGLCPTCEGHGYVFTEPAAHLSLMFWIIHPRKGASRGCEVERIEREDLPAVFAWLQEAARRNAERFSRLPVPQP